MIRISIITAIIIFAFAILFAHPITTSASLSPRMQAEQEKTMNYIYTKRAGRIQITPTAIPTPTQAVLAAKTVKRRIQPTNTPTLAPTRKPTATLIPSARPTRTPTATPTPQSQNNSGLLTSEEEYILNKINEYRASQNRASVSANRETCDFAKIRAEEISHNFNHDGFRNRVDSKSLPYSGYSSVTENIAMNSDYTDVTDRWIASSGHAENMRKDTPFVCVKKHGNYYAYEGWRP